MADQKILNVSSTLPDSPRLNTVSLVDSYDVTRNKLVFRSLQAGSNITLDLVEVSPGTKKIVVSNIGAVGEVNAGANLGGVGAGVYAGKEGTDLQFRRLVAGDNVVITEEPNILRISAVSNAAAVMPEITSLGAGSSVHAGGTSFRSLRAGRNVALAETAGEIVINAEFPVRPLTGGPGVTVETRDADVLISASVKVCDDTAPKLGGSLDLNGYMLMTSNGQDLVLRSSGRIVLNGMTLPGDGPAGGVLVATGTGQLVWEPRLTGLVDDPKPSLGNYLDVGGYGIVSSSGRDLLLNAAGRLVLDGLIWPTTDGLQGHCLTTDGQGTLRWTEPVTAQNVGQVGLGLFRGKSGTVLRLRNLAPASGRLTMQIDDSREVLLVDVVEGNISLNKLGGLLPVERGGTAATTAEMARANLGIGTLGSQDAAAVDILGGSINGTRIGGLTPAGGFFTELVATAADLDSLSADAAQIGSLVVADGHLNGVRIGQEVPAAGRFTDIQSDTAELAAVVTNDLMSGRGAFGTVEILAGTLDGVAIGRSKPATGRFSEFVLGDRAFPTAPGADGQALMVRGDTLVWADVQGPLTNLRFVDDQWSFDDAYQRACTTIVLAPGTYTITGAIRPGIDLVGLGHSSRVGVILDDAACSSPAGMTTLFRNLTLLGELVVDGDPDSSVVIEDCVVSEVTLVNGSLSLTDTMVMGVLEQKAGTLWVTNADLNAAGNTLQGGTAVLETIRGSVDSVTPWLQVANTTTIQGATFSNRTGDGVMVVGGVLRADRMIAGMDNGAIALAIRNGICMLGTNSIPDNLRDGTINPWFRIG